MFKCRYVSPKVMKLDSSNLMQSMGMLTGSSPSPPPPPPLPLPYDGDFDDEILDLSRSFKDYDNSSW